MTMPRRRSVNFCEPFEVEWTLTTNLTTNLATSPDYLIRSLDNFFVLGNGFSSRSPHWWGWRQNFDGKLSSKFRRRTARTVREIVKYCFETLHLTFVWPSLRNNLRVTLGRNVVVQHWTTLACNSSFTWLSTLWLPLTNLSNSGPPIFWDSWVPFRWIHMIVEETERSLTVWKIKAVVGWRQELQNGD